MRRLGRGDALSRALLLGGTFLAIAIWIAVAEPSPLSGPALVLGLGLGAALMQTLILTGGAIPGYTGGGSARQVGTGTAIGVVFAAFLTTAVSAVAPGALTALAVAFAAILAGFLLVLVPNLVRG